MGSRKPAKVAHLKVMSFAYCNESLREGDQTSLSAMCSVRMDFKDICLVLLSLIGNTSTYPENLAILFPIFHLC